MRRFFLKLIRRRQLEQDLEAEMAFHREMAAAEGNPTPFGNPSVVKEHALDLWRFTSFEDFWRDVRYGLRSLRRSPAFVLSALLSLALGIGANTAIFSLIVEIFLSPPSVEEPQRVASINFRGSSHTERRVREAVESSGLFAAVVGETEYPSLTWNDGTQTRRVVAIGTTKNFFTAMRIPMERGRGWSEQDRDRATVISNRFWQSHLNADPSIVGKTLVLDGQIYTVMGVLPANHKTLIGLGYSPDLYIPVTEPQAPLSLYGRVRPDMTIDATQTALRAVAQRLDSEVGGSPKLSSRVEVQPAMAFARLHNATMTIAVFLGVLMLLVFLVLVVACVNVANLMLVRNAARRQELAIRLSLGAARSRLLQQLMVESLLLSLTGALLGFGLAQVLAGAVTRIDLPMPIPIHFHIEPNWRVATYAAALSILATLMCGLLPAWQSTRASLIAHLQRAPRQRMGRYLVVAQITISVVVLSISALFLRNLIMAANTNLGFEMKQALRVETHLPTTKYNATAPMHGYVSAALDELRGIPGVESAAAARMLPFLDAEQNHVHFILSGSNEACELSVNQNSVTPDFFRAMRTPLLAGRSFTDADRTGAPVLIANRSFVNRCLHGRLTPGVTVRWGEGGDLYQITGIVEDTKVMTVGEDPRPQIYLPLFHGTEEAKRVEFVIRSATPVEQQIKAVRDAMHRLDPNVAVDVQSLETSMAFAYLPSRLGAGLMGSIGMLGLILAAIGLSGVTAYAVTRRSREIGIRLAIGASLRSVVQLVLSESVWLLVAGSLAGLFLALFIARPLTMFFVPGMSSTDSWAFFGVVAALFVTGVAASVGPIHRAVKIDPAVSLRDE